MSTTTSSSSARRRIDPDDAARSLSPSDPGPAHPPVISDPVRDWFTLRLAAAGLLATTTSALTLRPLLADLAWVIPVLVAVVAVVLTGVVVRQLTVLWPVTAAAQAAVLGVVLTVLFARDQALWGVLPGPGALTRLGDGLAEGAQVIGTSAPPAPTTPGMVLLVTLGIGVVGLLVDLVAVTLQRPAAAGLALLAVYCVPAAVLADGISWVYFVIAAVGYLVLISADGADRIEAWGRVLGAGAAGRQPRVGTPLQGGRRVALVALAVAVLVPVITPGVGERLLSTGDGPGEGRGSGRINVINPILTLRQNLSARSDTPVITYSTTVPDPEPLRIATDDYFDGERWAPSTGPISRRQRVQDGLPDPPGLGAAVTVDRYRTSIRVGNLSQTYLPLPYPTRLVEIDGDWLYEETSLNVVGDGQRTENTSYTAEHLVVSPTADQLAAAPRAPAVVREQFTALPDGLPVEIGTIAARVAGDGSDYEQALALQDYLRDSGGFAYDEQVTGNPGDDSGEDAVLAFLKAKRGYCVQFASAMAVMARTLGIPSRVAVGFLPGTKVGDDYEITLRDAHAWPELYFEGVGWTRFEPTPAARVANVPGYAEPAGANEGEPEATPSASVSAAPSAQASAQTRPSGVDEAVPVGGEPSRSFWQMLPKRLLAVLALLALFAAVPMIASTLARRRRWRTARSPGLVAEAAWDELRDGLGDLGVSWARSWTPRAMSHRLSTDHHLGGEEQAALARLVGDVEEARYAPPGQGPARTATAVRADAELVVRGVAAGRSATDRRRARFFPRSGLAALSGALSAASRRYSAGDVELDPPGAGVSGSTGPADELADGQTTARSTRGRD